MSAHWQGDFDLLREAREDARRDTPDEAELLRMQRASDEWVREVEGRPVGTTITRKAA